MAADLRGVTAGLLSNILGHGFKGFDPFDIKGLPFVCRLVRWGNSSRVGEILRETVLELFTAYPLAFRRLLAVKPSVNSKGLGLIGTACTELSLLEWFDRALLAESLDLCDRLLEESRASGVTGTAWGYPFDWQSAEMIPAGTPNGVATAAVGEYFWTRFRTSGRGEDLARCVGVANFLNSLPAAESKGGVLCFSYFPHYQNHIHNLNLFVADFLIKVGAAAGTDAWLERGQRALEYTLAQQRDDGAFDYNGPPETPVNMIDNHHTGFVLRSLASILFHTKRSDVSVALERGLGFYLEHFLRPDGAPRARWNRTYNISTHCAAEAINCLISVARYHDAAAGTAQSVLDWTMANLYDAENGDFLNGIRKSRFTGRISLSTVKYMRWSQAWMLRALSRYLLYQETRTVVV